MSGMARGAVSLHGKHPFPREGERLWRIYIPVA